MTTADEFHGFFAGEAEPMTETLRRVADALFPRPEYKQAVDALAELLEAGRPLAAMEVLRSACVTPGVVAA